MNLTVTTTVKLIFQVAYFEATEGGMDYAYYGKAVDSIPAAVEQWRLAMAQQPERDWMIVTIPDIQTK